MPLWLFYPLDFAGNTKANTHSLIHTHTHTQLLLNSADSRSNLSTQMQQSLADGQADSGTVVAVYWVSTQRFGCRSCTNSESLLHIWNKEASLGLPSVFTALLFFHTPRKILPKHTFQTHQLNMGGEKYTIFFHCKSCPQYQGRRAGKQKLGSWHGSEARQQGGSSAWRRKTVVCVCENPARPAWWLRCHMSSSEVKTAGGVAS